MSNNAKSSTVKSIKNLIEKNKKELVEDFYTFLRFPSISSEPEFKKSLLDCCDWLVNLLKQMGMEVEVWKTSTHPVIFASNCKAGPDKPTLLIYNHYDVQPVDPLDEWNSPPFEPISRNGDIYARGAQDNKGQCFYVLQALKLYLELYGSFPINIKLCIEGEEEMGSAGLSGIIKDKADKLKANYLAIVDLGLRDPKVPALTLGIRGITTLEVELIGSKIDLHSGVHGGIVMNPIHALVALLASLRDEKGRIKVPGFYDDVIEISNEERAEVSFSFDATDYQKKMEAIPAGGEREYSALERAWIRPTLEINGISGGYSGKGFKTVIPAKAFAKISCRLVPKQEPQKIATLVADYLRDNCPQGVQINIHIHPGSGKAVRASSSSKVVRAFSRAFEEVFDVPCECIFEGASIPIVPELSEACGAEVIMLGLGLQSDQIHAPNEHFGIDRLFKGILIVSRAIELLGN